MDQEIVRQEVFWVPENRQVLIEGDLNGSTVRIWTLYDYTDPEVRPELPYTPVHHGNAFLEDFGHDWHHIHQRGVLRYFSRAVHSNVWILVEFKAPPKNRKKG